MERTLREGLDVRAFYAHDPSRPLARVKNGTLILTADERGLLAGISLPDTTWARDLVEMRRHGFSGWSFSFAALADEWEWAMTDGLPRRTVIDMRVAEVSPGVAMPADGETERAGRGPASDIVHDAHRDAAVSMVRVIRALAVDFPDIRIGCRYVNGKAEGRLRDFARPSHRRLNEARQRLAEVML